MDELIGFGRGIIADGVVNQEEAEKLRNWIQVSEMRHVESPLVDDLFDCLDEALEDGVLDEDEGLELFEILTAIVGEPMEQGEMVKSASPFDDPPPKVVFTGKEFMFTGRFDQGSRSEHQAAVEARQGINSTSSTVTRTVDYLVIGPRATETWLHPTMGRKIKRAVELRELRRRPAIISEEHFVDSLAE